MGRRNWEFITTNCYGQREDRHSVWSAPNNHILQDYEVALRLYCAAIGSSLPQIVMGNGKTGTECGVLPVTTFCRTTRWRSGSIAPQLGVHYHKLLWATGRLAQCVECSQEPHSAGLRGGAQALLRRNWEFITTNCYGQREEWRSAWSAPNNHSAGLRGGAQALLCRNWEFIITTTCYGQREDWHSAWSAPNNPY